MSLMIFAQVVVGTITDLQLDSPERQPEPLKIDECSSFAVLTHSSISCPSSSAMAFGMSVNLLSEIAARSGAIVLARAISSGLHPAKDGQARGW